MRFWYIGKLFIKTKIDDECVIVKSSSGDCLFESTLLSFNLDE